MVQLFLTPEGRVKGGILENTVCEAFNVSVTAHPTDLTLLNKDETSVLHIIFGGACHF
jgi:hypothetical protein